MGVKKRFLCLTMAFFGVILLFSAFVLQDNGSRAQAYGSGSEGDGIGSEPGMDSKVQPADPLGFLGSGAAGDGGDIEITVYEQDLAFVKETREFELSNGVNLVEYTNVASGIDPASVMVEDPKSKETAVLEQNYEYDLVSSYSLLEKYLGREISATGGDGATYTGKLLSYEGGGLVLEQEGGNVVVLQDVMKVEVPDTSGLSTKPSLIWQLYSPVTGKRELLVSYLTGGMSWRADYTLKSNADDTRADIASLVSIDNRAGVAFEDASIKLVSGEINRVSAPRPVYEYAEEAAAEAPMEEPFTEAAFFEYHLYTLERPATLKNNQAKQISLFSASSVPVKKELIFDSSRGDKVRVFLSLPNSKENGLGMPLPRGIVKVYKTGAGGDLQFLGEDMIEHTPEGGELKVAVGSSFDVTATRTQTDYERISDNVERVSYEIELKNSKSEAQPVTVVEHFYGEWEILESSDKYEKTDAFTAEFRVTVPAKGTKTVTYTVENRF
ncbi:DUF4139 domain-containing protein [Methanosarcina sp. KYL-1]|uniref:DUF4139 domain-containing protein n=1 Tax=Methanosarcina sp. KYL-1 TaxID=2602068 RepID=UPI00210120E8|nr:DUF4139 domain-containing protein [Methanosarcina sp. KYL-1]MCQ1535036.1 DUF4139 domain-containing protein [Methanosarcina sp. KYL-1]